MSLLQILGQCEDRIQKPNVSEVMLFVLFTLFRLARILSQGQHGTTIAITATVCACLVKPGLNRATCEAPASSRSFGSLPRALVASSSYGRDKNRVTKEPQIEDVVQEDPFVTS